MPQARTALITGAGSGIGRATAQLLAQAGYRVWLVGRTRAKLEQTATLLGPASTGSAGAAGGHDLVHVHEADLADPAACRQAVQALADTWGRLDALVNVAGYASVVPLADITAQEWHTTFAINLAAAMHLTSAAWPLFQRQHSGIVVNVSSMASLDPFPGFSLYAPAKAALNMFTHVTAQEGSTIGVRAVAVAPGAVETPMLRALWNEQDLPRSHTLDPLLVAGVIRDCVTGKRDFTPGQTLPLPSR